MYNLLEYITQLAPKGETALIVRQKPQLKDGQMQFHADGAIKCTWPAYLPTQKMRKGEAWYINTASFIVDRFEEGRISASAANCEYVLFMMLDDIGTKSKIPPLEPTWILETSPNNFQYGYAFSEQPSKGEFTAAVKAIARQVTPMQGRLMPCVMYVCLVLSTLSLDVIILKHASWSSRLSVNTR